MQAILYKLGNSTPPLKCIAATVVGLQAATAIVALLVMTLNY